MCGLVGIMSSDLLPKHKDCFANLLYLDTWRGRDSTGVAALRSNADTHILKSTVPGYEFVEGPKLGEHLKLSDFLWIGHNRFGTMGKNIKTNAHPFEILDKDGSCIVVGAHNGTLKNKHVLHDHHSFGTDSEALYNQIALTGVEDALSKVEGAWALTYYDHNAEQFRVVRNKERSLFYAWSEDKKTLFWASEMWMLRVCTSRHDIKLYEDKVYSFTEDTLYSFSAPIKRHDEIKVEKKGGVVGKQTSDFFPKQNTGGQTGGPTQQETAQASSRGAVVPFQTPRLQQQHQSHLPLPGPVRQILTSRSGTPLSKAGEKPSLKSVSSSDGQSGTNGSVTNKTYRGYNGNPLTLNELKNMLDAGCAWCELEHISEAERFAWLAPGRAVCVKCLDGKHVPAVVTTNNRVHVN